MRLAGSARFDYRPAVPLVANSVVIGPASSLWSVASARKLRETLLRVRNEGLRKDRSDMLRSQEANIALANKVPAASNSPKNSGFPLRQRVLRSGGRLD